MPIQEEALDLLIRDLVRIVEQSGDRSARTVLRRLRLFRQIHMKEPDLPKAVKHEKKVLVLRLRGGKPLICDEYYPTDYGRIHIIPDAVYGHFHRDEMTVEYSKAAMDVDEIVYEGDQWPEGMIGAQVIRNYFFGEHQ